MTSEDTCNELTCVPFEGTISLIPTRYHLGVHVLERTISMLAKIPRGGLGRFESMTNDISTRPLPDVSFLCSATELIVLMAPYSHEETRLQPRIWSPIHWTRNHPNPPYSRPRCSSRIPLPRSRKRLYQRRHLVQHDSLSLFNWRHFRLAQTRSPPDDSTCSPSRLP